MVEAGLTIEVVDEAGDWDFGAVETILARILPVLDRHLAGVAGTATLALADDALVRDLNRRFRGKDRPTNVLSFPSGEVPAPGAPLGDIVVARETVEREAALDGKPFDHHLIHLVIHGLLHLLGYDHESDDEAEAMERLETAVLADLGIPDPYAEPVTSAGN
ncbi:putative rRNA maturation factor [Tepidamorphus gemmatus]|uniref:Endoribonuclease YbeY n=1 Tax=Tepidamorphus gemmatus TaxID=747076 RepID=A0A4R3MJP4_9HYPH|nr:rRNA maturation RNase YbeY [Tepidamorphus gemmatus]TCT11975.1 putative rRNA maturation factor [Tepidamorphus gemmatus]